MRALLSAIVVLCAWRLPAGAEPTPRMEKGMVARLGIGANVVRNLSEVTLDGGTRFRTVDFGTGSSLDIQIGLLVDPGLALCVVIGADFAFDTSISGESADLFPPADSVGIYTFGVSMLYYFDPRGPWFVNGGIGFGDVAKDSGSLVEEEEAPGLGAFFGGGWEYPVGNRLAFGAAARALVVQGESGGTRQHGLGVSVMATTSLNLGW